MKKYKVKTTSLNDYQAGEIVYPVNIDGAGFPISPEDCKAINKEIIERNPDWFEPVERVQEGQYWELTGDIVRVNNIYKRSNCKALIAEAIDISNKSYDWRVKKFINDARKLSTDEIEEALIAEAKRRFNKGDIVKTSEFNMGNTKNSEPFKVSLNDFSYHKVDDQLYEGNILLYKEGKWAEIKESEIEINGKQIDVDDGTLLIECGDRIEEDTFKAFYALVKKYDLEVRSGGEPINDQLQQISRKMPLKVTSSDTISWDVADLESFGVTITEGGIKYSVDEPETGGRKNL